LTAPEEAATAPEEEAATAPDEAATAPDEEAATAPEDAATTPDEDEEGRTTPEDVTAAAAELRPAEEAATELRPPEEAAAAEAAIDDPNTLGWADDPATDTDAATDDTPCDNVTDGEVPVITCWKNAAANPGTSEYTVGVVVAHPAASPKLTIPITCASIGLLMLEVVKRAPPLSPWQVSLPPTPPAQTLTPEIMVLQKLALQVVKLTYGTST